MYIKGMYFNIFVVICYIIYFVTHLEFRGDHTIDMKFNIRKIERNISLSFKEG